MDVLGCVDLLYGISKELMWLNNVLIIFENIELIDKEQSKIESDH